MLAHGCRHRSMCDSRYAIQEGVVQQQLEHAVLGTRGHRWQGVGCHRARSSSGVVRDSHQVACRIQKRVTGDMMWETHVRSLHGLPQHRSAEAYQATGSCHPRPDPPHQRPRSPETCHRPGFGGCAPWLARCSSCKLACDNHLSASRPRPRITARLATHLVLTACCSCFCTADCTVFLIVPLNSFTTRL